MPIVETPEEAIELFLDSGLHVFGYWAIFVFKKHSRLSLTRFLNAGGV